MVACAGAGFLVGVNFPLFTVLGAMVKESFDAAHATEAVHYCFLGTEHGAPTEPLLGKFSGPDTSLALTFATPLAKNGLISHFIFQFTFQLRRSRDHRNTRLTMGVVPYRMRGLVLSLARLMR